MLHLFNRKSRSKFRPHSHSHSHSHPRIIATFIFLSVFTVFSIMGGKKLWVWMQEPTSFPITQFKIEGQLLHETPEILQKILHAGVHGGFFSLDVTQAKSQLLSQPWISYVSFRRVWPTTLHVCVHEHVALARFGNKGVLTTTGHIFYPAINTIPDGLPQLSGLADQAENLTQSYQAFNSLVKMLGLTVTALRVNAEQSWDLVLSNQIRVILGRVDTVKRFQQFVFIYPKIIASSKQTVTLIDLRYPNGVAVQYQ